MGGGISKIGEAETCGDGHGPIPAILQEGQRGIHQRPGPRGDPHPARLLMPSRDCPPSR